MRKYQNNIGIFMMNFMVLILGVVLLTYIFLSPFKSYQVCDGNIVLDNIYELLVDRKTLKCLQRNKYVYVDGEKKKFEIISVNRNYYKNYNQVLVRCKSRKEKISISIYRGKKSFLTMFLECWEEDK